MIGRILQWIFLRKSARRKVAARRPASATKTRDKGKPPGAPKRADGAARERLMKEAMQVYRTQRKEYENLDPETRRQIEADAEKAFGKALKPRDGGR